MFSPQSSPFRLIGFAAKNVCLAGVKSVTLYDPAPVEIADLGAQVCLQPCKLKQRSECDPPMPVFPS